MRDLTNAEMDLIVGLLCTFSLEMHHAKKKPGLSKEGLAELDESFFLAQSAKFKLLGKRA